MTFTSLYFPLFVSVSLFAYYAVAKSARFQNLVISLASLFFYGFGHLHYLLIFGSVTLFTYFSSFAIEGSNSARYRNTFLSITSLVLFFILIKYASMFASLFNSKLPDSIEKFQLLLPVGLSFYSFTCIGYLADIYNKRITACKNPLQFFAYSSFFPQLLSGPISFADKQLPQFENKRTFSFQNIKDALPFITWGLFKKAVIANTIAKPVAYIFSQSADQNATSLIIGVVLYSIQIYADFSGYSDMAYGIARCFGIEIPLNFRMPYFSSSIAEYWKRWHYSLSKWLGRYIYIPLGGNRSSFFSHLRNIMIVFAVSGLWHGADIKFVLWGLLNGLFFVVYLIYSKLQNATSRINSSMVTNKLFLPSGILLTFMCVTIARVYFRSETFEAGNHYLMLILNQVNLTKPIFGIKYLSICAAFIAFEWFRKEELSPLIFKHTQKLWQIGAYVIALALITYSLQQPQSTEHIYFKF